VARVAKLSLSRAWDETREVIARDGKLIATVALALFFLPGVVVGVIDPAAKPFPTTVKEAVIALVVALIALVGQLAIIRMALGARMTVGEAIGHGARRTPVYIAAGLIWAGPLILAGYFLGGEVWQAPQSASGGQLTAALIIVLALFIVGIRMMMTSSVASAEPAGPLEIVKRSWRLTSGHWWKLFGLICIFLLLMLVIMAAAGAIIGILSALLFDPIEPMSAGALFVAALTQLVSAVLTTGLLVMLARIYAQLSGPAHDDVTVPSSGT
jgi:Membrane domain of glycerophosphoryl diester phosphodiesterase